MNTAKNFEILASVGQSHLYLKQVESLAISINQDWENETTIYEFADGSILKHSNGDFEEFTA